MYEESPRQNKGVSTPSRQDIERAIQVNNKHITTIMGAVMQQRIANNQTEQPYEAIEGELRDVDVA